jgi:hypothetical protein
MGKYFSDSCLADILPVPVDKGLMDFSFTIWGV